MKNPFTKLIHHYTYDMRLKTKLVISHIILVLLPTAVLSGFLYLRIYGIVMDDSIRSEQALSAQTVTSIENLVSHVGHASDTITGAMMVQDLFQVPRSEANTLDISTSRMNSLFHLVQSITDHSMIMDVKIYYDDSVYGDLMQYNKIGNALFNPVSSISSSYWYGIFSTSEQTRLLCPELYLLQAIRLHDFRLHIFHMPCICHEYDFIYYRRGFKHFQRIGHQRLAADFHVLLCRIPAHSAALPCCQDHSRTIFLFHCRPPPSSFPDRSPFVPYIPAVCTLRPNFQISDRL